jgi:D-alanyl-D-alanine carboxypeptidase (penicillin-binding protein 5/6)
MIPAWFRGIVLATLFVTLLGSDRTRPASAQDDLSDSISSKHYIVIDADTGEVFAQKDADDERAIASLTKIYTTIEALERAPLDMQITTDESDLFDASSTTMGFGAGETFSLEDLLYGMLLPSGNDAAHAIARSIGALPGDGDPEVSVSRYVGWMNQRISNMGLTETHLVNPHGLGVPGHHSSAHDLAVFTMYALNYPLFVDIIGTSSYDAGGYEVTNTNKLLGNYDGLIGGKTGYDDDAGWCLVEVASRDGSTMISVTLDGVAPDVWYQDNAILLDYAFEQKAARTAAGDPITNSVVSYRDPNAAVVEQMSTPGAALGTTATSVATEAPNSTVTPPVTPTVVPNASPEGGGTNWALIAAVAVVVVVIGVSASGAIFGKHVTKPPKSPHETDSS